ncbi:MAG: VOC family protein [Nocardioidaceae bacterium]
MQSTPQITAITPRLVVDGAATALDFYARALGAVEQERHEYDGRVVHALISIDGHPVAVKDADDVDPSPRALGGSPAILSVDVVDADAVATRMVDAGAREVFAVDDHGYGYRDGRFEDPFGHLWLISQRLA